MRNNPIFSREGFPRFWRRSSPGARRAMLAGYVAVGALPTAAVIYFWRPLGSAADGMLPAILLMPLSYWPTLLAPAIAPALTAGAIAGERERRSWDLLVLTRLTGGEIVWGKLLSRLMPLLWITIPFIPLVAALLIRGGGVNPWARLGAWSMPGATSAQALPQLAWPFAVAPWVTGLMVAFANGVMALYVSFRSSSTRSAMIVSYGIAVGASMLVTMAVTALSMLIFIPAIRAGVVSGGAPSPAPPFLGAIHPSRMIWMIAAGQAAPLLWGVLVPAILLPMLVRRFHGLDSRARAG